MTRSHRTRPLGRLAAAAALLLPLSAHATDGASMVAPPGGGEAALNTSATYYETVVDGATVQSLSTADPTLPTELVIDHATAVATYRPIAQTATSIEWQLRIEGFERRHERVDGIYDMVLVVPLPAAQGRDAFEATKRGFFVEEGGADASVPLIYGGEKVVLKRNVGIEKSLLPQLSGHDGLPDLAGSGYRWTAWDTVMQRDDSHQDVVQARGHLEYTTALGVAAPDPNDARLAAYLITWIPGLPANIAPFSVRMDVAPPSQ